MRLSKRQVQALLARGATLSDAAPNAPKPSKFGNVRTPVTIGTVVLWFDSAGEADRYQQLQLLEQAGVITNLRPNVQQRKKQRFVIVGKRTYEPDYTYTENGQQVAEDWKGFATEVFKLKAALFRERYPDIELRITGKSTR